MVSHIRLENTQNYKQQICLSFMTGLYGCRWKRYQRSTEPTTKFEKTWVFLVALSFAFVAVMLYYWVMAQNDFEYFNRFIYYRIGSWFDWYTLFYILTILTLIYTGILLVLAIAHGVTGRQLYLHWGHKIPTLFILMICTVAVILLNKFWLEEWILVAITLQVTAPILQIIAVVILTVITWPLAGFWWRSGHIVFRCVAFVLYISLLLFVYLSPLIMQAPCVLTAADLPPKPHIMAHTGAEQIAPENTVISFEIAANYSVYGFESDVRISLDGIPFLMHDNSLARTTNVHEVFPNRTDLRAEGFTWKELQALDAGSWYLQRDPYHKARYIPEHTKEKFKKQKIPSLAELLKLAIVYNKSVVFDLQKPPSGHPFYNDFTELVVDTILTSGIPQEKIWWLSGERRSWVETAAPGFIQTAEGFFPLSYLDRNNISNVNVEYTEVNNDEIRFYAEKSITTNVYVINTLGLFSIYWCVGAHSVTSGAVQDLHEVQAPIWHMTPTAFLIISVVLGAASAICVIAIFLIQKCRHPVRETNPESISLHSPRHFAGSTTKKSDRELLYRTNEDTMFSATHAAGKSIQPEQTPKEEPRPQPSMEEGEPPLYQDDLDAMGVSSIAGTANMHQEVKMQLE